MAPNHTVGEGAGSPAATEGAAPLSGAPAASAPHLDVQQHGTPQHHNSAVQGVKHDSVADSSATEVAPTESKPEPPSGEAVASPAKAANIPAPQKHAAPAEPAEPASGLAPSVYTSSLADGTSSIASTSVTSFDTTGPIEPAAPDSVMDEDEFSLQDWDCESTDSTSTSLRSSLYEHMYVNGRRYHKFRNGRYPIPNDNEEQMREESLHYMVMEALDGRLFFSPIGDHPQKIIDLGTGTGSWAIAGRLSHCPSRSAVAQSKSANTSCSSPSRRQVSQRTSYWRRP